MNRKNTDFPGRLLILTLLPAAISVLLSGCAKPVSPVGVSSRAHNGPLWGNKGVQTAESADASGPASSAGLSDSVKTGAADNSVTAPGESVAGDPGGTPVEFWTYNERHAEYYKKLLQLWNDQNPDHTLQITFKTMPYEELHTAFIEALKNGSGAPDLCDIDAYRFGEVSSGPDSSLYPLDVATAPYVYELHPARLDVYKGSDGKLYGVPFRMGAAVQYWNTVLLQSAGITNKEIDAVTTWDDFYALGEKYLASGKGSFTVVDEASAVWPMLASAQFSAEEEPVADAASRMSELHKKWFDGGIAKKTSDMDPEIASGNAATFTASLAYMDRFINDMHDQTDTWYITKCPVFKAGQPCSVCLDDVVTVISSQSHAPALAADYVCFAKLYTDNARSYLWPDLSYDVCNIPLWDNEEFSHDRTNEYDTFFVNYPYDVLNEISDRIATVTP